MIAKPLLQSTFFAVAFATLLFACGCGSPIPPDYADDAARVRYRLVPGVW